MDPADSRDFQHATIIFTRTNTNSHNTSRTIRWENPYLRDPSNPSTLLGANPVNHHVRPIPNRLHDIFPNRGVDQPCQFQGAGIILKAFDSPKSLRFPTGNSTSARGTPLFTQTSTPEVFANYTRILLTKEICATEIVFLLGMFVQSSKLVILLK